MSDARQRLAENIARIRCRIEDAAGRSGRPAESVVFVAVTKYVAADATAWLPGVGCWALGESRPQALWTKATAITDPRVEWHLIGHLQRNKIHRTLPCVRWIHSVDSPRLLDALQQAAATGAPRPRVLLEVNVAGEPAKTGFSADMARQLAAHWDRWPDVQIEGLMTMSALDSDAAGARRDFARLRALRDVMQRDCPPRITLRHLSMGMSDDFEEAIEEGATLVRVGSAVWEGVVA